jgi:arylsulfatase
MNKKYISMSCMVLAVSVLTTQFACCDSSKADALKGARPNIVLIMTDDNSFDTIGRYGGGASSPHLDKLYDQAVRLSRFHVSPTCAPSRAALMTGRHEFYAGITHTIYGRDRMNLKRTTVAQMLKQSGYTTGMFGKWHLGDEKPYRPYQRGFDEVWQHGSGGIGQSYPNSADFPANTYHDPVLLHNEKPVETEGYCTDIFFDKAMEWIRQDCPSDQPFFAYIAPNLSHTPYIPPDGYDERMPGASNYEKMQANIDDNVGKMIAFLEAAGLRDNTLFIFYTDNGRKGQTVYGTALKGGKGKATEGGLWVPCLVSWPGHLPENTDRDELCGHIDWFMTFSALAGNDIKAPGTETWDGRNILPVLCGEAEDDWDNRLFIGHRCRWDNGKAAESKYNECSIQNGTFKLYNNSELYDMRADLSEQNNIAAQYPEVVATLQKEYDRFWVDASGYFVNDENPLPDQAIEKEPFHVLYRETFGEEAYQKKMDRLGKWETMPKPRRGQPIEDYIQSQQKNTDH